MILRLLLTTGTLISLAPGYAQQPTLPPAVTNYGVGGINGTGGSNFAPTPIPNGYSVVFSNQVGSGSASATAVLSPSPVLSASAANACQLPPGNSSCNIAEGQVEVTYYFAVFGPTANVPATLSVKAQGQVQSSGDTTLSSADALVTIGAPGSVLLSAEACVPGTCGRPSQFSIAQNVSVLTSDPTAPSTSWNIYYVTINSSADAESSPDYGLNASSSSSIQFPVLALDSASSSAGDTLVLSPGVGAGQTAATAAGPSEDVPIPLWALGALGAGLAASIPRRKARTAL